MLWLMTLSVASGQEKQPGELLSAAQYEEEVTGNLAEAIKTYQLIIDRYPGEQRIAAEALLHLGLCYEKLGNAEAVKAYEKLLLSYSGQRDQVLIAQARLLELRKEKANGFMVEKMDFRITESFDLSPDGTKILGVEFEKGQNIVVSHLNTNKIDFITNFEWGDEYTWCYNPIWSPDGKEIAFNASFEDKQHQSAHSLIISGSNAEKRVLVKSNTTWYVPNAWMPDGSAVLVISQDQDNLQKLGLVDARTGDFKELVSLNGKVTTDGSSRAASCFSPDGRFIVYTDRVIDEDLGLFIIPSAGGEPKPVASHPEVDKWPRWSPDGTHIIFLSNRHGSMALWGIAIEEGNPSGVPFLIREGMGNNFLGNWTRHGLVSDIWIRILDLYQLELNPATKEPAGDLSLLSYTPSGNNTRVAYAPDGKRLAFIRSDRDLGQNYLVLTGTDGKNKREFDIPSGYSLTDLRWSAQSQVLGSIGTNENDERLFLTFNLDSEKWESVPLGHGWSTFDWTADGKSMLYGENGMAETGAGIFEHDLETGTTKKVYIPPTQSSVTFRGLKCSNDYSKAAFLEGNDSLVVLDLKSGERRVLTEGAWWYPSWSADGEKIMTVGSTAPDQNGVNLFVHPLDGGQADSYDLSQYLPVDSRIYGYQVSPDNRYITINLEQRLSEHVIYRNIIPDF